MPEISNGSRTNDAEVGKAAIARYLLLLMLIFSSHSAGQDWCESAGGCDEYISRVTLNEIDNTSGCVGYSDFMSVQTRLELGRDYLITIELGSAYGSDSGGVWIDWNHDYLLDEDEEKVVLDVSGGFGPYYGTVHVPASGDPVETVMRVRLCYNQTPYPCGVTNYGEVEDYVVRLVSEIYECGDANGDDDINLADAVFILNYVFKGGPAPDPPDAGDANCSSDINIADAVSLIHYIFHNGPAPCCP